MVNNPYNHIGVMRCAFENDEKEKTSIHEA